MNSKWVFALFLVLAVASVAAAQLSPPPLVAGGLAQAAGLEGRVLWVDGLANLAVLRSREGIDQIFERCHAAHINTVVVDAKPLNGYVLYNSRVAPQLKEWRGITWPADHDLLAHAMHQAHRRGMKVHIALNVFSEGHKLNNAGPIYERPEQQAIVYDFRRTVRATTGAQHQVALGANLGPGAQEISIYDDERTPPRSLSEAEAAVVVIQDVVAAVIEGGIPDVEPIAIPKDGFVLFGQGEGAAWLLKNVNVGDRLGWSGREVLLPITQSPSDPYGVFVNPAHPEVRAYALRIVDEIVDNYAIDGLVFDRMRYASLSTDFSDVSRRQFETWLGRPVTRWPQEIFEYDPVPNRKVIRGPLFASWLEWRARTMRDWLAEATELIHRKRPGCLVGAYTGSWYDSSFQVGVNWAADDYAAGLDWMSPAYSQTGYAGLLDWITTGCYFPVARREDARAAGAPERFTVEAAAEYATRVVNDATFHYAGINLADYRGRPEAFRNAVQAARKNSQGVMLFDLVYVEEYGWWDLIKELFATPQRAPHDIPGLRDALRQAHRSLAEANR